MANEIDGSFNPEVPYSESYGYSDGFPINDPITPRYEAPTAPEIKSSHFFSGEGAIHNTKIGTLSGIVGSVLKDGAENELGTQQHDAQEVGVNAGLEGVKGGVAGYIEFRAEKQLSTSIFGTAETLITKGALKGSASGIGAGLVVTSTTIYTEGRDYLEGKTSGSVAGGRIVAEGAIALSSAAVGAAIGSIVPGPGTLIGGAAGFIVGVVAGVAADIGARRLGVDKTIASNTSAGLHQVADYVKEFGRDVVTGAGVIAEDTKRVARDVVDGISNGASAIKKGILGLFE